MITSVLNKGLKLTFKNGITISIQIGTVNYCERKNNLSKYRSEMDLAEVSSKDAEIAIWDKRGEWHSFGEDTVKGWIESDEIAVWIEKCKNAKNIKDIKN